MTLRALDQLDKFSGFGSDAPPEGSKRRAMIFVLDSGYAWPMKVLWHTLAKSGALIDLPVIIATEDESLFEDPVVDLVADIKFVIDRESAGILDEAAAHAKEREGKEAWTRATFLKWISFRDWGFDEVLFLDCDMIALQSLSDIFAEDGEIVGSPQFQKVLLQDPDGARRPESEVRERLGRFVHELKGSPLSLNSGVMVLRGNVLSQQFLREIVAFTRTLACINEQQYITRFLRSGSTTAKLQLVSPIFNFQDAFLGKVTLLAQLQFLKEMRVLHYAGGGKPWKQPASDKSSIGQFLWWKADAEAKGYLQHAPAAARR